MILARVIEIILGHLQNHRDFSKKSRQDNNIITWHLFCQHSSLHSQQDFEYKYSTQPGNKCYSRLWPILTMFYIVRAVCFALGHLLSNKKLVRVSIFMTEDRKTRAYNVCNEDQMFVIFLLLSGYYKVSLSSMPCLRAHAA